ncbi:MAG: hypothetical protein IKY52_02980 [Clostridia bacterium]|nr:hypothetical protein [Clostridia bacterium]
MEIHFSHEQFQTLRQTYQKWWAGELKRPIVPIVTYGHPSTVSPSNGPFLWCGTAWDFSIDPRQFIESHHAGLTTQRWHGEAFPHFSTTAFGPGTLAAFLGCTPIGAWNTVWFKPPCEDIPIEELHFEFDENNPNYRRVLNLYEAAMEKWHGSVVVGMVDMGGILDVLQSFRGAENLLMDLYDDPDEVARCVKELQELWFVYYNKFNAIMAPEAEGYTDWYHMYGEKPGYILQSDFSYMIGPKIFDTFVAPELASSAAKITNAVYHMDGIGQIPHLDSLLAIDDIKGIQWQPGVGEPEKQNWDDILSRILASGKKLIYLAQKPDGHPIDIANDPGQLYFEDRSWHINDIVEAQKYGNLYGIEVKES